MKRDTDLMLKILSYIEERPDVPTAMLAPNDFKDIEKDPYKTFLHLELLHDAGLIEMEDIHVVRLTMAGYDYLYARQTSMPATT